VLSLFENITPEDLEKGRKYLMSGSVGGKLPIIIESGYGAVIVDREGKEYIDCTSQAWTYNIGFNHPRVVQAAIEQVQKITHVRTSFETIPKLILLKKLGEMTPGDLKQISFCLHGSVANEGAMKLAMINRPEGMKFFVPYSNYSGRTLATIAASYVDPEVSAPFKLFMNHFIRFPEAYCYRCYFHRTYPSCDFECVKFLEEMIRVNEPAYAIIMEPMPASGGMIEYPAGYLPKIRELCDKYGILLIYDEIQTAFGRLGAMFASEMYGALPDIFTFGKAIAGGYPLAGVVASSRLKPFPPATDSFTFSHFPLSFATACATLDVLVEEKLPQRAKEMGEYITAHLKKMQERYEIIGDVRGPGLMIGIELVKDRETKEPANVIANRIVEEAIEDGVIFGHSRFKGQGNVVKIKPPLVITRKQADKVLEVFEKYISHYDKHRI
jgi:4-aminobutyrate aminotransferase-like enzyme